jgi:hypothetical protein
MERLNALILGLRRFPNMRLPEAFVALTIWSTYLIPKLISGVAVSHLTGLALIASCAPLVLRRNSREATAAFFLFVGMRSFSMLSASFVGFQERFPFEAIKTIIVFVVTFFVGFSVPASRINDLLEPSPWLFLVFIAGVFAFVGNPFGLDGRLQIEGFISSNVLGFLAVLNMAIILNRPKLYLFDYATLFAITIVMLLCLSRSAMLGALALVWVRIGWGRGVLIFGSIAGAMAVIFAGNKIIQRMLVLEDVMTNGGSGRTELWRFLVGNWFDTPTNWLFGFGPGGVHRHPHWLATEDAAHSMIIGGFYYWGIAGFLFVMGLFACAVREISRTPVSPERNMARDILLIMLANGAVDESYNGSQVNAISAIFFGLVLAVIAESRRQRREEVRGPMVSAL